MKKFPIWDICRERVYNAEGANELFQTVESRNIQPQDELEFDFSRVGAISTSFAGRFMEQVHELRYMHGTIRVKITNANRSIADSLKAK